MKKNKKITVSEPSAEAREGINAENADISNPQSGENKSFDAESENEKAAEFQALIEGKYKKQFSEKVQSIIRRRLKEVKKLNSTEKENKTPERMEDAMNSVAENSKHTELIKRLIRENSLLKKDRDDRLRDMKKQTFSEKIKTQTEEAKEAYPEFDLASEVKNPEFCRLVRAGVSVKNAYEVINIDSIMEAKKIDTEKKVLDSIRLKGSRPIENGSETGGGFLLSNNISRLGRKERAELAKRAARGEKIEF